MGQLEMFAQRTFAEETERITSGAAQWQEPAEIRLEKVTSDGFLAVRQPDALAKLAAPWSLARAFAEVMLELKLADWVLTMLEFMPMSTLAREDLLWRFGKSDDPEIEARRQHILRVLLEVNPQDKQVLVQEAVAQAAAQAHEQGLEQGLEQGRLTEARASLRRVLARRQLMPTHDEDARIETCADLETLRRWQDQAVTAANVPEALA